uniref:Uncharacterized protein n=1 Tax=Rhipicephalus appendiculatus TaxID=34631 RepID=A0A131YHF4_RHIAP
MTKLSCFHILLVFATFAFLLPSIKKKESSIVFGYPAPGALSSCCGRTTQRPVPPRNIGLRPRLHPNLARHHPLRRPVRRQPLGAPRPVRHPHNPPRRHGS